MIAQAHNAKTIFLNALEIASTSERQAFVAGACGDDEGLRREVEDLLQHHAGVESFLEAPGPGLARTAREIPVTERPGTVIGPYKLTEQIGEGGMGLVFVADQQQPVRRKVALKVIKPGMDSAQVIARFEAERQALALMDHPNIARVLDAGATPAGRPYFVMELVHGIPITDYCDEARLGVPARLRLFIDVCRAVQHAHTKGVIHRDLKPTNVLVTSHDGVPMPKVIDFGVAKALGPALTERTLHTDFAQIIGTPLYMSPEQAEFNQLGVDTRSDVYALGVLLYELLTGATPFDPEALKAAGVDELRRIIREDEPPRPSQRLSTLAAERQVTVSQRRGVDGRRLGQLLRGELDWIVMRALEKDRSRRYETANGFATDVQRYLNDETVQACPPSTGYRFRKFARRNRTMLTTAAVVSAALIVGTAVSTWQAVRATDAEKRAVAQQQIAEGNLQKAREAVDKFLLQVSEDRRLKERDLQELRTKLLQSAVPFYQQFIQQKTDEPARQADLGGAYLKLGTLHTETGNNEEALEDFEQMRAVFQSLAAAFPSVPEYRAEVARSHNNIGKVLKDLERPELALAAIEDGLTIFERLAKEYPGEPKYRWEVGRVRANLATQLTQLNRPDEALAASDQVLETQRQLHADFPTVADYRDDLAHTHNDRGRLFVGLGKMDEALASFQAAVQIQEELTKEFPGVSGYRWALSMSLNNQGISLMRLRRLKEALAPHERAFAIQQELRHSFPGLPEYRRTSANSGLNLANLLRALDRRDESVATYDEAVRLYEELIGQFPLVPGYRLEMAVCASNRGIVLHELKRREPAKASLRLGITHLEKVYKDYPDVPIHAVQLGSSHKNLGMILKEYSELPAALDHLNKAIRTFEPVYAKEPRAFQARIGLRSAHVGRGQTLVLFDKHAEAIPDFDRGIELDTGEDRPQFRLERAACLVHLNKWTEAVAEADTIAAAHDVKKSDLYGAACVYGLVAGAVKDDAKSVELYGARAVALLRQAAAAGFDVLAQQQKDTELDPLRNRADFQQLLKELGAKAMEDAKQ